MSRRTGGALLLGALAFAVALVACADPTEIRVTVTTDLPCSDVGKIEVRVGKSSADVSGPLAQVTESTTCTGGNLGTLTIIPSGSNDATVYVRVLLGKAAADCTPPGASCIVADRSVAFVPGETRALPIAMTLACRGVPCTAGNTCIAGVCKSANL